MCLAFIAPARRLICPQAGPVGSPVRRTGDAMLDQGSTVDIGGGGDEINDAVTGAVRLV